jgi:hypothetical protein
VQQFVRNDAKLFSCGSCYCNKEPGDPVQDRQASWLPPNLVAAEAILVLNKRFATANYATRNQRYKLLGKKGVEEFYDLSKTPTSTIIYLSAT